MAMYAKIKSTKGHHLILCYIAENINPTASECNISGHMHGNIYIYYVCIGSFAYFGDRKSINKSLIWIWSGNIAEHCVSNHNARFKVPEQFCFHFICYICNFSCYCVSLSCSLSTYLQYRCLAVAQKSTEQQQRQHEH